MSLSRSDISVASLALASCLILASPHGRSALAGQPGGQGLGLFFTRRVCERFGWRLTLSSHPGQGTLAELRFPG